MSTLPRSFQRFQEQYPYPWKAFQSLGAAAAQAGPLEVKVNVLVELG
jgi:hypothetical protein